ncbi:MAG TPA: hypothetical protein VFG50_15460 [Rhodothermales bacterium]|nr:hypothetical protein [Rhodothermales bacterium]
MLLRFRIPVLLVCLFGLTLPALAQEKPATSLRNGAWALQFGVSQNFTLTSFEGSTISAKHHASDNSAWRYGLTLNGEFGSQGAASDESPDSKSKDNHQRLALSIVYISYPDVIERPLDVVHLYWGIGPNVSFSRSRSQDAAGSSIMTTQGLGAGLGGLIGAEWFVAPRISLTAEYGSALRYERNATTIKPDDVYGPGSTVSSNTFGLFSQGVKFGISVYVSPGK